MDWGQLTGTTTAAGSIAGWINNSKITSGPGGVADTILQEAMSAIWRRLRHWRMLTPPVAFTMTIGADQIALPADFLEPSQLWITGIYKRRLVQTTEDLLFRMWNYDSNGNRVPQQPGAYFFNQTYLQLDSPPDQAYPYLLTYFQQPAALSASNPTNFITNFYPRLLRCTVMAAASEWAKDAGQGSYDRTYWLQLAQDEIDRAQVESDRARHKVEIGASLEGPIGPDPWW